MSQPATPLRGEEAEPWVPSIPTETFAQRLRFLRLALSISMGQAAEAVGVSEPTWRTWENGSSSPRNMAEVTDSLHDAYNVSRNWLMWGNAVERYTDSPVQGRFFDETGAPEAELTGSRHLVSVVAPALTDA